MPITPPFALVLSGGGLKGLAHIGTFRALTEFGLTPDVVVGTSMGALIAAAWASGVSVEEMDDRARGVRRRDVFRVAHTDMAFRRMKAPAIYRREPLAELIHSLVGDRTFKDLEHKLIVNTVDLNAGMQVLWGAPGLQDVRVADAVFGACALPGVFPPQEIGGRHFVDGAVVDNLPLRAAAALNPNAIVAVDLGSSGVLRSDVEEAGFAATYVRGLEIVMQTLVSNTLATWTTPPVLLVRPRVERIPMFAFDQTADLLDEGYRATRDLLSRYGEGFEFRTGGVYPKRTVHITVDESRCIGCRSCVALAPDIFHMGEDGKAKVISPTQTWSPVDGRYIWNCPTYAISARGEGGEADPGG